jgi:hypothetical protein
MHVDLGKGQSAEVIDVDDVPRKIKFKVQEWLLAEFNRENGMHATMAMMISRDMLLARVIESWTLDLPLPNGDPQYLGDLPSSVYDALVEATKPHYEDLDFIKEGRAALTTAKSSDSSPSSEESPSPDTNPIPVT